MGESYAWLNDGKLNMVKYCVCTQIENREINLFPNFSRLQKQANKHKCKVVKHNYKMGQYFAEGFKVYQYSLTWHSCQLMVE